MMEPHIFPHQLDTHAKLFRRKLIHPQAHEQHDHDELDRGNASRFPEHVIRRLIPHEHPQNGIRPMDHFLEFLRGRERHPEPFLELDYGALIRDRPRVEFLHDVEGVSYTPEIATAVVVPVEGDPAF